MIEGLPVLVEVNGLLPWEEVFQGDVIAVDHSKKGMLECEDSVEQRTEIVVVCITL